MEAKIGLRERKRQRTHRTISDTAIALFVERGYDNVSIAEIAEAAEVSRRTLFTYFPSKDDLVLHRFADHEDEPARIVRQRQDNESPLDALHRQFRTALIGRDAITGLCDEPSVVVFYRLVLETPSLRSALTGFLVRSENALADALREAAPDDTFADTTAKLAAVQISAIRITLSQQNQARIVAGQTADALEPRALAEADLAFDMLRNGLRAYS